MVLVVSHPGELERMVREYSEATTEEISRKKMSSVMKGSRTREKKQKRVKKSRNMLERLKD